MILLDTSILSLAFRRQPGGAPEPRELEILRQLISEDAPLAIPGIAVQELLSGVRDEARFRTARQHLAGFQVILAEEPDHHFAARVFNACLDSGITPSTVDCLIAAQTIANSAELWTLDRDFSDIARCTALKLFRPR